MNGEFYCKHLKKKIPIKYCTGCVNKQFRWYKSKRTRSLEIPKKVKSKVWERDKHRCIFCGKLVNWELANSHFIKRSHGGLGIEQNILTNCEECHRLFDDSIKREEMYEIAKRYLAMKYENWNEEDLIYKKS